MIQKGLFAKSSLLVILSLTAPAAFSQITINIPGVKIKKNSPPPEKPKTTDAPATPTPKETSSQAKEEPYSETDGRLLSFLDDLDEAQKELEAYSPATYDSLVSNSSESALRQAISPKERKEFMDKWSVVMRPKDRERFNSRFDTLAELAAKKIPLYVLEPKDYAFRNPTEERLIKAKMSDVPGMVVHKIGLSQSTWLISKNDIGFPTSRYKHGIIWGRDPNSDHPYCKFWYVNIIQDYAGGGTYAASYAKYITSDIAGCPTGSK